MKLNVIEKWLNHETDMGTWLTSTNMSIPLSSPAHSPRHHGTRSFIFLCKFVNSTTVFMQPERRMATIDFIALAISGKLFERYDYDEYQE